MSINDILIESTKKLISLSTENDWINELLNNAPPVLWFGNSISEKPKILTLGANPSRWEFLNKSIRKNSLNIKTEYEKYYLDTAKRRIYQLDKYQHYQEILSNFELQNDIIATYNHYFKSGNSYHWFGKNKTNPHNAEGVLRSLNASYFEINTKYRTCHIDLFPFATISNFNSIQHITKRDILADSWAKNIVDELLDYLKPQLIIVFGRSNFDYFCNYFDITKGKPVKWSSTNSIAKCDYYFTRYKSYQIIGLTVNLGDPRGFNANDLSELGQKLLLEIGN
jgi:hypothetical protein